MDDSRTFGERVSDAIADFGGSWKFIFLAIFAICAWIVFNIFVFTYDPYPFILLNLFLSLVAAFQAPFILMAQRRVERKQDMAYRYLFQEIKELCEKEIDTQQTQMQHIEDLRKLVKDMRELKEDD